MKNIILILLYLGIGVSSKAQDKNERVVNPTRIPVSSLQTFLLTNNPSNGALGNVGVASSPDISNWIINVAKNAFQVEKNGISVSYMPNESRLIRGMNMFSLTGYSSLKNEKYGILSYNLMNYSYGTTELRDDNATFLGNQSSNDFALKVGYSKKLGKYISGGVALGYYRSNLFGTQSLLNSYFKPASGIHGDIGFYRNGFEISKKDYWNFGASIINLGGKINYGDEKMWSYAPMQFRMGTAYNYIFDENQNNKIALLLDMTKDLIPTPSGNIDKTTAVGNSLSYLFTSWGDAPNGFKEELQELRWHFGAEYLHKNLLAIRTGYQQENKYKGDRKHLAFGVGLHNLGGNDVKFNIDGSYSFPVSSVGIAPTFRLSIGAFFGEQ
jgi:Type IX secretion system protein PorV